MSPSDSYDLRQPSRRARSTRSRSRRIDTTIRLARKTRTALPVAEATLEALADRASIPRYERHGRGPRIVHLGAGNFHRAHQALFVDELAELGSTWRIVGVGPLEADRAVAAALAAQDTLYTLVERGARPTRPRVVGSIVDYILASDRTTDVVDAIARAETVIVTLTVTEGGYAPAEDDVPGVFDIIARGAERRRRAGIEPLTVLSCDNVVHNGLAAKAATLRSARRISRELETWMESSCAFPSSMVDRITPSTSDADRQWLRDTHGIDDRWPVITEGFRQWVIEEAFAGSRPPLEDVGVTFTDDVTPWEQYKLRILNASHSLIAYPAALAGLGWVDEALTVPALRSFIETFLESEVFPTLPAIAGHPAPEYARSVLERFSMGGVKDRVERLCMDGTVKLATFLVPTLAANVRSGGPLVAAATALAAWASYLATVPLDAQAPDAFGAEAREYAIAALTEPAAFLEFRRVFPADVASDPRFRDAFAASLRSIADIGPLASLEGALTPG